MWDRRISRVVPGVIPVLCDESFLFRARDHCWFVPGRDHVVSQSEQEIAKLDTEQTQKRKAVKNHLAQFLKEGQDIQQKWEYSNLNAPQEKKDWENRVEAYLTKELGESYAVRFRGPTLQIVSFPADMNPKMQGQWGETTAKMAMLNDFISGLPN